MKKDKQVKFYTYSDLMIRCEAIFERQGCDLSEGMTRLVKFLADSSDEMTPIILGQAHGNAIKVLAESVVRQIDGDKAFSHRVAAMKKKKRPPTDQ